MTSRKSKQRRLDQGRLQRANQLSGIDPTAPHASPPPGAIAADPSQLTHNNTYGLLPSFYIDKIIRCRQCGNEEVWPAERQKWWYEVAKGNINTEAVLCRACRQKKRERKTEARRVHLEGIARKRGRTKASK